MGAGGIGAAGVGVGEATSSEELGESLGRLLEGPLVEPSDARFADLPLPIVRGKSGRGGESEAGRATQPPSCRQGRVWSDGEPPRASTSPVNELLCGGIHMRIPRDDFVIVYSRQETRTPPDRPPPETTS
eukprot:scaffold62713_cov29-Tisochrysis_lutea.AAC.1